MSGREILFRGKRKDNGEWIYGVPITDESTNDAYIITSTAGASLKSEINNMCATGFRIIRNTIGQYTGLTDKNGTRIFEGDIIKSEQDGMIGVIRFGEYQTTNYGNGECHLGFSIEWYGKYSDLLRRDLGWWVKFGNTDINIFGTIHDNPELLKGEQKNETTT